MIRVLLRRVLGEISTTISSSKKGTVDVSCRLLVGEEGMDEAYRLGRRGLSTVKAMVMAMVVGKTPHHALLEDLKFNV